MQLFLLKRIILVNKVLVVLLTSFLATAVLAKQRQPNILWIVTDDQRPDSVSAYNKAVFGSKNSPLGHVESPNIDKLAAEGVLFTHAFTNSPVCGPSRGSMHSGRYPFRNGHYAFELTHQNPDFIKPTVSQTMRSNGYATATFGKSGHYIYKWGPGQGFHDAKLFDQRIHFKNDLQKNGFGDLFTKAQYDKNFNIIGYTENILYANGAKRKYYLKRHNAKLSATDKAQKLAIEKEFDILRAYTRGNTDLILGGVNPKPVGETIDAYIVKEFQHYLQNPNKEYPSLWGKKMQGANTATPQFLHLGFHLPHTPVLPPKSFRDKFKDKRYMVPDFSKKELAKLPKQLLGIYQTSKIAGMSNDEIQQAIQDYYAFCAYGDYLIGEAVASFKKYSESNNQEYVIIMTVGDHGWHLGEQGMEAKFGPWQQSVGNAAIVVASDKSLVPANKVNTDLVEFVDFAPTIMAAGGVDISQEKFDYLDGVNLIDVYQKKVAKREYILGEINVISGPRAYLHSKRFRFSMRTRPFSNIKLKPAQLGKDLTWALTAPAQSVEMALYDLAKDPLEQNNVAYDKEYQALATWFRNKLGNIVLGDRRVEADWSQANTYHISEFALGFDDKKLAIPIALMPST